jgi:hypothetical protein
MNVGLIYISVFYKENKMSYAYYEKTGCMFEGSEMEFQNRLPKCNCFMPWTDEEGYFSYFLCTKDFEVCRHNCKHHKYKRKLNEDIREFFEATCERYRK